MLNPAGGSWEICRLRVSRKDRFLIVGSGFARSSTCAGSAASEPPADVWVRSAASTLNGVSIAGPRSRELVQRLVRDDLSPSAFKLFQVSEDGRRLCAGHPDACRVHR